MRGGGRCLKMCSTGSKNSTKSLLKVKHLEDEVVSLRQYLRCDERLKTKTEESTRLGYTGLIGELEHLKIKTRLIDDMFVSVIGIPSF